MDRPGVNPIGTWTISVCVLFVLAAAALTPRADMPDEPPATDATVDFNRDVRPILARNCLLCHGNDPSSRKADLRLDDRNAATTPQGERSRAAIVPGDADASELIRRVTSLDPDVRMPPDDRQPLTQAEIDTLRRWINQGAPYAKHWSWQPIVRVEPPHADDPAWNESDVDRFLYDRLRQAGLTPADEADRQTLIRRVTFDLTGLPPAAEDVESFVRDQSPDAYEKVVDRLLASPAFGERWARHWLDLMRYAETHGHEYDYPIHHAWKYRDYVIRAFNDDVPYDRFVTEHIAGDLLDPRVNPQTGVNESILATGWWWLSQGTHGPVDVRMDEADRIDNQIDVLTKSFLGLTVGCARCHDHKFDDIKAEDYYALSGFIQSSRRQIAYLDPHARIGAAAAGLAEIRHAIESALKTTNAPDHLTTTLTAARDVLFGQPSPDEPQPERPDIIFDDFESGTYDAWEVTGTAFGDRPRRHADIAPYQGAINAQGAFFVNTHQTRSGEDIREADAHKGRLTSRTFTIERRHIRFLIGGGGHEGRTCINLLVDGKPARTAVGRFSNAMREESWDVSDLIGTQARLEIVDDESGGWGQIGIDDIRLSDRPVGVRPLRRSVTVVAREHGLDESDLARWVDALRALPETHDHPMAAWVILAESDDVDESRGRLLRQLLERESLASEANARDVLFESFNNATGRRWYPEGWAWAGTPTRAGQWSIGARTLAEDGVADSASLGGRLQGTIRSETFELTSKQIVYRVRGTGRIRLIIDGYWLDEFNTLLFNGMLVDVNAEQWTDHVQDVSMYVGHRAWIELIDDGDGSLAVDEIRFNDAGAPPRSPHPTTMRIALDGAVTTPHSLAMAFEREIADAVAALREDRADSSHADLLRWLMREELLHPTPPASIDAYLAQADKLLAETPLPARALAITDGTGEDEYVFIRGDHRQRGPVVHRRFIASIAGDQSPIEHGSGRLELARRILDESNPLTPRVMVNRVWRHLFGRGIVHTTDDFGALGAIPTHPELLDYLAHWYRHDAHWSTKKLIRTLVTTRAYRMASTGGGGSIAPTIDPNNELFYQARVRRLEGEAIRDAILAVSAGLDSTMFGEPIPIHLTPFMNGRGRPGRSGPLDGDRRRSIYIAVRRNFLSPMMLAFDSPVPFTTVGRRNESNVPAQSLILMNDPFVIEQMHVWAKRLIDAGPQSIEGRIDSMFLDALSRPPTGSERSALASFIADQAAERAFDPLTSVEVWADACHVIVNMKEFIYLH